MQSDKLVQSQCTTTFKQFQGAKTIEVFKTVKACYNSYNFGHNREEIKMAETENSKDLICVLWSGADILRSKMDANEYKDFLLGIVFYKYLSDSLLMKVYDLLYMKSRLPAKKGDFLP